MSLLPQVRFQEIFDGFLWDFWCHILCRKVCWHLSFAQFWFFCRFSLPFGLGLALGGRAFIRLNFAQHEAFFP